MAREYGSVSVANRSKAPFAFFDRNGRVVTLDPGRKVSGVEVHAAVARKIWAQAQVPTSGIAISGAEGALNEDQLRAWEQAENPDAANKSIPETMPEASTAPTEPVEPEPPKTVDDQEPEKTVA